MRVMAQDDILYSQVQSCDRSYQLPHMLVAWPIVNDIGPEPTPAQKTVAVGGHPFWLSQVNQDDFYTIGALSNVSPIKVRMWILNSFSDAAFSNAFDAWSVFADVDTNSKRVENGFHALEVLSMMIPQTCCGILI